VVELGDGVRRLPQGGEEDVGGPQGGRRRGGGGAGPEGNGVPKSGGDPVLAQTRGRVDQESLVSSELEELTEGGFESRSRDGVSFAARFDGL